MRTSLVSSQAAHVPPTPHPPRYPHPTAPFQVVSQKNTRHYSLRPGVHGLSSDQIRISYYIESRRYGNHHLFVITRRPAQHILRIKHSRSLESKILCERDLWGCAASLSESQFTQTLTLITPLMTVPPRVDSHLVCDTLSSSFPMWSEKATYKRHAVRGCPVPSAITDTITHISLTDPTIDPHFHNGQVQITIRPPADLSACPTYPIFRWR